MRAFFTREYPSWDARFRREAIAPIENKVGRLMASAPLRNVLAQVENRFDFDFILSRGRIFVANLAKGTLGEDKANLLGSLLASQFAVAALRRSRLPEEERTPFFLYIDEFQSFTTDAFTAILAEARKYGLSLTLAHQYFDQLAPEIRRAIFGNVVTLIAFRVGERDAEILEAEFGGSMKRGHLVSLQTHEVAVRLLDHGLPLEPFREMVERYLASPAWMDLQETTQRTRRKRLEWWIGRIGDLQLLAVTSEVVAEHRDALRAGDCPSAGRVSGPTSNRYVGALSSVFNWALGDLHSWLPHGNPCRERARPRPQRGLRRAPPPSAR